MTFYYKSVSVSSIFDITQRRFNDYEYYDDVNYISDDEDGGSDGNDVDNDA